MSGEMCDNFTNRLIGAKILTKECNNLRFNNFFTLNLKRFLQKNLTINTLFHLIGTVLEDF